AEATKTNRFSQGSAIVASIFLRAACNSAASTLRRRCLQSLQRRLDRSGRNSEEAGEGHVQLENEKDRARDRERAERDRRDGRRVETRQHAKAAKQQHRPC